MTNPILKTASVLAFERKLDPSDALFSSGTWDDKKNSKTWPSVEVRKKSVRGTIVNRLKNNELDPAKLDADIEKPNLQTVDVATLPHDDDTLKVTFTLRVLPGTGVPSACNDTGYQRKLHDTVMRYVTDHGFGVLTRRYASNIANGRWLWRNRIGAESVEVQVSDMVAGCASKTWIFDALTLPLRDFREPSASSANLDELSALVAAGLAGERHVLLEVTAFVRVGNGQEVFPSQELILDTKKPGKILYTVKKIAAMHSQKVGNALRTVDTWYAVTDDVPPIAVDTYGAVTTEGKAYRQPQAKIDFYHLLDGWLLKDRVPSVGDQHFVIAMLVRGGVFGESKKAKSDVVEE